MKSTINSCIKQCVDATDNYTDNSELEKEIATSQNKTIRLN